jgi:aspartate ammonia-lyase
MIFLKLTNPTTGKSFYLNCDQIVSINQGEKGVRILATDCVDELNANAYECEETVEEIINMLRSSGHIEILS